MKMVGRTPAVRKSEGLAEVRRWHQADPGGSITVHGDACLGPSRHGKAPPLRSAGPVLAGTAQSCCFSRWLPGSPACDLVPNGLCRSISKDLVRWGICCDDVTEEVAKNTILNAINLDPLITHVQSKEEIADRQED